MECPENLAYIDERHRTLTHAELPYQRKTFSFEDPHTCFHCQDVFLTIAANATITSCLDCPWRGVGARAPDGRHRLCGQCGQPYEDTTMMKYSATLGYTLREAIAASKEGCAVYEWLVDMVALNIVERKDWRLSEFLRSPAYKFQLFALAFDSGPNVGCKLSVGLTSASTLATGTTSNTLSLDYLQGWTTMSDPAAKYISSRPYEQDVKSARSIQFARDCFQECLGNHYRCIPFLTDEADRRDRTPGPIKALARETVDIAHAPSRLIYVNPDAEAEQQSQVVLIELSEATDERKADISRSGYIVLSLTRQSHQDLKTGVNISKLPQTLQDAVWVTREMQGKYLWVDALCIFQDSDEDKTSELARMATYYSCAMLTICAAAASKATQGFLHVREPSAFGFGPVRLPLRLRLQDGEVKEVEAGNVYILNEESQPSPEPTVLRGWTLQESLLSRRILVFAQRQLYWCCVNSFAGCGGEFVALVGRVVGNPATLVDNIHPMGSLMDRPTDNQWKTVVAQYTRRRLGFAGDKLLAIAALAESLERLCAERGEETSYLAGLLVQTAQPILFLEQLLWYSAAPRLRTRRAIPYRSPSWSWAAIDGPVQFASVDRHRTTMAVTVADVSVDLVVPTARFGSVCGGFLVLEGRCRMSPVADFVRLPFGHRIVDEWTGREALDKSDEGIEFFPDTEEDGAAIKSTFRGIEPSRPLFLVNLGWVDRETIRPPRISVRAVGLVVARSSGIQEAFTRIGVFRILRDEHNTSLADNDLDSLFLSRNSLSIRLI
ncbi:heterokaryon incompatibility protein-domain-containing protein [Nemania sp. FL0916]|nr:heterokaryon incompatibility protein-domain-containing protein [Nemania sp. FL0916]